MLSKNSTTIIPFQTNTVPEELWILILKMLGQPISALALMARLNKHLNAFVAHIFAHPECIAPFHIIPATQHGPLGRSTTQQARELINFFYSCEQFLYNPKFLYTPDESKFAEDESTLADSSQRSNFFNQLTKFRHRIPQKNLNDIFVCASAYLNYVVPIPNEEAADNPVAHHLLKQKHRELIKWALACGQSAETISTLIKEQHIDCANRDECNVFYEAASYDCDHTVLSLFAEKVVKNGDPLSHFLFYRFADPDVCPLLLTIANGFYSMAAWMIEQLEQQYIFPTKTIFDAQKKLLKNPKATVLIEALLIHTDLLIVMRKLSSLPEKNILPQYQQLRQLYNEHKELGVLLWLLNENKIETAIKFIKTRSWFDFSDKALNLRLPNIVRLGQFNLLECLITKAGVTITDPQLLFDAIDSNCDKTFALLFTRFNPAQVLLCRKEQQNVLNYALAHHGNIKILKLLQPHFKKLETAQTEQQQKLLNGILTFNLDGIRQAVAAGADPLTIDGKGNTVTHLTLQHIARQTNTHRAQHISHVPAILDYFMQCGVMPTTQNHDGKTALYYAACTQDQPCVETLLKNSNISVFDLDAEGNNLLHLCDIMPEGLEHDTKIKLLTQPNQAGQLPIHRAAARGAWAAVECYHAIMPANTALSDPSGNLALHYAATEFFGDNTTHCPWAKLAFVKTLQIHNKIEINSNNTAQETALIRAAQVGNLNFATALCQNFKKANPAIDVNAADKQNNTALHHAVRNNHLNMVNFLLTQGTDIYQKNQQQETPLALAIRLKRPEIVAAFNPFNSATALSYTDLETQVQHMAVFDSAWKRLASRFSFNELHRLPQQNAEAFTRKTQTLLSQLYTWQTTGAQTPAKALLHKCNTYTNRQSLAEHIRRFTENPVKSTQNFIRSFVFAPTPTKSKKEHWSNAAISPSQTKKLRISGIAAGILIGVIAFLLFFFLLIPILPPGYFSTLLGAFESFIDASTQDKAVLIIKILSGVIPSIFIAITAGLIVTTAGVPLTKLSMTRPAMDKAKEIADEIELITKNQDSLEAAAVVLDIGDDTEQPSERDSALTLFADYESTQQPTQGSSPTMATHENIFCDDSPNASDEDDTDAIELTPLLDGSAHSIYSSASSSSEFSPF